MRRSRKRSTFRLPGGNLLWAAGAILVALCVALLIWRPWSLNADVKETTALQTPVVSQVPEDDETIVSSDVTPEPSPAGDTTAAPAKPTVEQAPAVDMSSAVMPKAAEGYLPVCSKGTATDVKQIAITIDDLWQSENVKELLTICAQYGAKVTFFPIGEAVAEQAELLKLIYEDGHEIENHTYTHVNLYGLTAEEMSEEVLRQNRLINEALGVDYQMHFLRPRGGNANYDKRMHNLLSQLGYVGVSHWNVSGTPDMSTWAGNLQSGDILLFHTTDGDLAKLRKLIPKLTEVGYQLVTLNTLYGLPANETYPLGSTDIGQSSRLDYTAMESDVPFTALQKGDCSYAVQRLQKRLLELGYYSAACDGDFGSGTAEAVMRFQKSVGLTEDGIAGQETQKALFQSDAPRASTAA